MIFIEELNCLTVIKSKHWMKGKLLFWKEYLYQKIANKNVQVSKTKEEFFFIYWINSVAKCNKERYFILNDCLQNLISEYKHTMSKCECIIKCKENKSGI